MFYNMLIYLKQMKSWQPDVKHRIDEALAHTDY
jgi:hypothetical protein